MKFGSNFKLRRLKRNLLPKIRGAKRYKSISEKEGHRKCMVLLKFLENIAGAVAPPPPSPCT